MSTKAAVLVALVLTNVARLHAQTGDSLARESHLYDPFQLSGYIALLDLSTKVQVNSSDGTIGTEVDVENDLGAPKWVWEPAVSFRWRPGRRHELELGYLFARRSHEKGL